MEKNVFIKQNRKYLIILAALIGLNWYYGFDARFTIINLLWLVVSLVKW
jgi:hypothetical protein